MGKTTGFIAALLLGVGCWGSNPLTAAEVANGIYYIKLQGAGPSITRYDEEEGEEREVVLGDLLSDDFGQVSIGSTGNDNSSFHIGLNELKLSPQEDPLVLVVDGMGLVVSVRGISGNKPDRILDSLFSSIRGEEAAKKIATSLKVKLGLYHDPGHRFRVRWTPEKKQFTLGEPMLLKMEIRNVGTGPFSFQVGGSQRGARDNQYAFIAHGGKSVPDTGDSSHWGGPAYFHTLKPGETFTNTVDITKWFHFTAAGDYRITGVYELPLCEINPESGSGGTVWDDLAVGRCMIEVVEKKRP